MALGDIIKTLHYEVVYGRKGTGTLVAGRSVSVDASGDFIPSTTTTLGVHGMYTGLTEVRGAVTYYQILIEGYGAGEMGGAVKPNNGIKSDANGKFIVASTTVTATYVQGETQELWKVSGRYLRLRSDNQFNPSDAADTSEGVIKVGRGVA